MIADADAELEKAHAAERGNADWRRVEHAFVRHGYRIEELRQMTRAEISARVDLIVGKVKGVRYVSKRVRKPLPKPK
ncbi:hypothetical protein NWF32_00145 [Pseudomonas qingdaonensis]|nr:hypothetical protein [Pseudomonas qingdaonensis]